MSDDTSKPPTSDAATQKLDRATALAAAIAIWKKNGFFHLMAPEDAAESFQDLLPQLERTHLITQQMLVSGGGQQVDVDEPSSDRAKYERARGRLIDSIHSMIATIELMRADDTTGTHKQLLGLHARAGAQATTELAALLNAVDAFWRKDSKA